MGTTRILTFVTSSSKTETTTHVQRDSMPHDHITLAQAPNGEIGPRCESCGIRLTFGNAMAVGKYYMCWEHYVKATGADTSTTVGEAEERFWMSE